ncbi:unnamed protein product [Boreogadus saida]
MPLQMAAPSVGAHQASPAKSKLSGAHGLLDPFSFGPVNTAVDAGMQILASIGWKHRPSDATGREVREIRSSPLSESPSLFRPSGFNTGSATSGVYCKGTSKHAQITETEDPSTGALDPSTPTH